MLGVRWWGLPDDCDAVDGGSGDAGEGVGGGRRGEARASPETPNRDRGQHKHGTEALPDEESLESRLEGRGDDRALHD